MAHTRQRMSLVGWAYGESTAGGVGVYGFTGGALGIGVEEEMAPRTQKRTSQIRMLVCGRWYSHGYGAYAKGGVYGGQFQNM